AVPALRPSAAPRPCGQLPGLRRSRHACRKNARDRGAPGMTAKQHARSLVWPTILMVLSFALVLFGADLAAQLRLGGNVALAATALTYFATAWFASRILAVALDRAARRRPFPRLL